MSSPYGREMTTVKILKLDTEVETFIPLQRYERMVGIRNRKRVISYRPVVRNLLFVKATRSKMRVLKQENNTLLQFKVHPEEGHYKPIVVPDKQMEDFMKLYENVADEELEFFMPGEIEFRPDARVVIEDGPFTGLEGYYQRVRGRRAKRFIVRIEGFLSCAAFLADCRFLSLPRSNRRGRGHQGKDNP